MGASNSDVDSSSPGGGGSRKKRPTAEEMTAIRAPGQRNQAGGKSSVGMKGRGRMVSAESYNVRPKEPGGVDDRAPVKSSAQRAYESIQELRQRRDNPQLPGIFSGIANRSLNDQIKKLQEGGTPVMSGTMTVGVISQGGSYTGRPEYGDFARSQYRTAKGEIRVPIGARRSQPSGDGDSQVTAPATKPSAPTVTPVSQPPSMGDDAARRAMLSGGAGSAARRKYINR